MLAVGCDEEVRQLLLKSVTAGKAVIAAFNSPGNVTFSGDEEAILELQQRAEEKRLFNRKLHVDMAYHSHHMELVAEQYLDLVRGILPAEGHGVDFYSTVTGCKLESSALQSSYWVDNLTSPVKFLDAILAMCHTWPSNRH